MKLIDRYVFGQVVPIFLMGILTFTGLFLGAGAITQIIRLAIDYNVKLNILLIALLYKLPEIITYTMPMSTLFSIIFTFNRMSSDLEITSLRSAGISFLRLMAPALIFSYAVSLCALYVNDRVVPSANTKFNIMMTGLKTSDSTDIRDIQIMDRKGKELSRILYVNRVRGTHLSGITLQEFEKKKLVRFLIANDGEWKSGNVLSLTGIEMMILYPRFGKAGYSDSTTSASTPKTMEITFDQSLNKMMRNQKQPGELTIREQRAQIVDLEKQGVNPSLLRKGVFDWNNKLAIPFASFAFALIAAPLALRPARASSTIGIGISVVIILLYYIFQQIFRVLGMQYLNPAAAAWMPNIILFAIGIWLCARAKK